MMPLFHDNLIKKTQYELWLITEIYRVTEQELYPTWPDSAIYPSTAVEPLFYAHVAANIRLGDWRPGFLGVGAPLVFMTSFKLLDMVIEAILEDNGKPSTYRFAEKISALEEPLGLPPLLASRPWLWDRIVALYKELDPLRGTVIHNHEFSANDGSLTVRSTRKGVIGPEQVFSSEEISRFALTMASIVNFLTGSWIFDMTHEKRLRYNIDQLSALHKAPSLAQLEPFFLTVRVYLESDRLELVDITKIRKDLETRYRDQECLFNLRLIEIYDRKPKMAYFIPWGKIMSKKWDHISLVEHEDQLPNDMQEDHYLK